MKKRFGCLKALLILVVVFIAYRIYNRAPTESELIANFYAHEANFERLNRMLDEDHNLEAINSDRLEYAYSDSSTKTSANKNLSAERIALYRTIMKEVGVGHVVNRPPRWRHLEVFGGGFTDTSWGIGYTWFRQPPSPIVKFAYAIPHHSGIHYSHIKGNWYIYHRR